MAALVLVVASVGGAVFAQQDEPTAEPKEWVLSQEEIASLPRLSPGEMLSTSGERIGFISAQVGEIKQRLTASAKEKDVVRYNCLFEISTRMKGHFTAAEQRMQRLRDAAARLAHDEMYQLYAEILVFTQKVEYLAGEGRACVGASDVVGQTTVEVVGPTSPGEPSLGGTDIMGPGSPDRTPLDRPLPISPWK